MCGHRRVPRHLPHGGPGVWSHIISDIRSSLWLCLEQLRKGADAAAGQSHQCAVRDPRVHHRERLHDHEQGEHVQGDLHSSGRGLLFLPVSHYFRPSYKNLDRLKTLFPRVPILALTATPYMQWIKSAQLTRTSFTLLP